MMLIHRRTVLLSALAAPALLRSAQAAPEKIRLGQATTSLSFVKIFAARALDTFAAQDLALEWAIIPGGDPPALAAVDSGDLDIAAVGSDTALSAIAKEQPFKIIYSLMSKMSLELTVSQAFLKRSGITPDAPLEQRIAVLKDALVGVSAVGGTQDRAVKWLATKGRLDPKAIKVALIGGPPALGAALESGRIDAFMLSPPEGDIAEANGYGVTLIKPYKEIPGIAGLPSLVLVSQMKPNPAARERIVRALRAINKATDALVADTDGVAERIQSKYFAKIPSTIFQRSIKSMADGLGNNGQLDQAAANLLLSFSSEIGGVVPRNNDFWTNDFVEASLKP